MFIRSFLDFQITNQSLDYVLLVISCFLFFSGLFLFVLIGLSVCLSRIFARFYNISLFIKDKTKTVIIFKKLSLNVNYYKCESSSIVVCCLYYVLISA